MKLIMTCHCQAFSATTAGSYTMIGIWSRFPPLNDQWLNWFFDDQSSEKTIGFLGRV
jgi:hypothetical protein